MMEKMPQEFKEINKVKDALKTANALLNGNDAKEDGKDSAFANVWNNVNHPFWGEPQLISCLRYIEKAAEQNKIRAKKSENANISKADGKKVDEHYLRTFNDLGTQAAASTQISPGKTTNLPDIATKTSKKKKQIKTANMNSKKQCCFNDFLSEHCLWFTKIMNWECLEFVLMIRLQYLKDNDEIN